MSHITENIRYIGTSAAEDFRTNSLRDKAIFIGTTALLSAHEFGMEAALAATGVGVYAETGNPLLVGAAMGAFSLSVENTLTTGIAKSLQSAQHTTQAIKNRYFTEVDTVEDRLSHGKRLADAVDGVALALSLGSPGIMFREYGRNPDRTYAEHLSTGRRTAKSLAAFNFTLGGLITGGSWLSEKLGVPQVSRAILEIGDSPITYASIIGIVVGPRILRARKKHQMSKNIENGSISIAGTLPIASLTAELREIN